MTLGLAGCARPGPDPTGTLRLADTVDIRTLDTAIGYDLPSWRFERLIFDGLLNYSPTDATLVPAVAQSLPTIEDGRRFTFRLREGVYFHNGRQVVAEDFKYAITRILDKKTASPARSLFEGIVGGRAFSNGQATKVAGLQCPDPMTLVVELEAPDLAFLNVLTMPFAYAIPREEVEKYSAADWPRHAVGCGPYRLAAWEPGVRLRVERFDRYYDPGRGRLKAIEMRFGVPDYLQLMMFERGELDVSGIPTADFDRVMRSPKLSPLVHSMDENAVTYASMNCEMAPFDNIKVRQAFNYAVNRQRLVQLAAGTVRPAGGVLPPGMPGYDPAHLPAYPYDPSKAKALLAEAGYANGLTVELTTRDRPAERRLGEALQSDLKAVGVTVAMRSISFPKWLDLASRRGGLPFTITSWFQDYPDPSNFLDVLLNGRRITDTRCQNYAFYNNPAVNDLLDRAAAMTDSAIRLDLYRQAERLVVADAPWLFLSFPRRFVLVQSWLKGYQMHPVWLSREDLCWLEPAAP